ncbi:nucleoside phosphatase family-domain-containing protein [Rhodotorula diobovata]|uniref:guanosine-diphosphatase n=1 Tax=Rhodotorula diobovata TaxID=5288 RepID=A0A5C5G1S1_9BASI|nr:nucleoside phosphatase family-domain-containing protein [Rhodotorula diobovata]
MRTGTRRGASAGGNDKGDRFSSSHPFRSLTPRRIAAIAAGLLFVIFFLGKSSGGGREGYHSAAVETLTAGGVAPKEAAVEVDKLPPGSPQKQASASSGKCTPPPGKKATTYAIMIDAGSTGSRLHMYTFSHCDPNPEALPKLEDELFVTTKPGLSSYKGKPRDAAESLRSLMQQAVDAVPESERSCTPIAVKATAGLRLLGSKESQDILDEVERWLTNEWPFAVVKDGVVVMDGKDEGVYAWITINFLLGFIGPDQPASAGTAAVMDLGGASTQIVFEPIYDPGASDKLAPGDHIYELDFAGQDHVLYQHSHLGYGLMQARRALHNLVAYSYVWSSAPKGHPVEWDDLSPRDRIPNPCMFRGETKKVTLDPPGRKERQVTMVGTGAGFEACRRVMEVMINKDAACEKPPCAFAGVYQPRMSEVFSAGKVWALSYFYDRIAPLGLSSPFSISSLRQLTTDVCAGRDSPSWARFKGNSEAHEELSDRPEYCLDLTFMYSLLSLGYELEEERQVWMGKKVGDVELGWCVSPSLLLLLQARERPLTTSRIQGARRSPRDGRGTLVVPRRLGGAAPSDGLRPGSRPRGGEVSP